MPHPVPLGIRQETLLRAETQLTDRVGRSFSLDALEREDFANTRNEWIVLKGYCVKIERDEKDESFCLEWRG